MSITPGPWAAIPDSGEDSEGDWYILTNDEDVIATGLSEPDAALIAAAPDLLAALKLCAETLQGCDPGNPEDETGWENRHLFEPWLAARNAIAKAEGAS